jgi:hypothetical protein
LEIIVDKEQAGQQQTESEWVNGSEAIRLSGRLSWSKLHRNALLGKIAVQLPPGEPPRYSRADVLAFARPVPQAVGA